MVDARLQNGDEARRNTRGRFEQWAQNPACQANTVSAVHNVRMADVARAEGFEPTMGQSPFAIARGEQFERNLLNNEAERLLEALIETGVLPEGASGLQDFRIRINGGPIPTLDEAVEETKDFLRGVANGSERSMALVAGATVRIPRGVMLPEAVLILDALAIRLDRTPVELIVGEIKTYPDRGGHTDSRELSVARAQAGLYLHAIQLVVEDLGIGDSIAVRDDGFLVLTRPGSNWPSVRPFEDLRYQAERTRRGFELLEAAAAGLPPFDRLSDDPVEAVRESETQLSEPCLTFCDRAAKCYTDALEAGDPVALGDDVPRFLGSIELARAVQLLNGDQPRNPAEEDLVVRIRQAEGSYSQ